MYVRWYSIYNTWIHVSDVCVKMELRGRTVLLDFLDFIDLFIVLLHKICFAQQFLTTMFFINTSVTSTLLVNYVMLCWSLCVDLWYPDKRQSGATFGWISCWIYLLPTLQFLSVSDRDFPDTRFFFIEDLRPSDVLMWTLFHHISTDCKGIFEDANRTSMYLCSQTRSLFLLNWNGIIWKIICENQMWVLYVQVG